MGRQRQPPQQPKSPNPKQTNPTKTQNYCKTSTYKTLTSETLTANTNIPKPKYPNKKPIPKTKQNRDKPKKCFLILIFQLSTMEIFFTYVVSLFYGSLFHEFLTIWSIQRIQVHHPHILYSKHV